MHMHVYSMHMHLSSSRGTPMRYENKVVLITGGGGGIGRAAAERFLAEGARVVPSGPRQKKLEAARDALDPSGERIHIHAGQVTTREEAQALVAAAVEHFGRVDVLVNSTGIFRIVPFLEQTEEHFEKALGPILRPTHGVSQPTEDPSEEALASILLPTSWVSQPAAAAMRAQGDGGAIVSVRSMWAIDPI